MNPMWMANWDVPQLADAPEREIIEEEIREARWQYPQVLDEFSEQQAGPARSVPDGWRASST